MISIVDPEELEHVLRPTVYAPAVNAPPPKFAADATSADGQSRPPMSDRGVANRIAEGRSAR